MNMGGKKVLMVSKNAPACSTLAKRNKIAKFGRNKVANETKIEATKVRKKERKTLRIKARDF